MKKIKKLNCWEFKKCGRETGGGKVSLRGICSATNDASADGLNNGRYAGRICWAVAGTLCDGEVQGTSAEKELSCTTCDFYEKVKSEEGFVNYKIFKPEQLEEEKA